MATVTIRNSIAKQLLTLSLILSSLPILITAIVYWTNYNAANQQRASRAAGLPTMVKAQQVSAATSALAATGAVFPQARTRTEVRAIEQTTANELREIRLALEDPATATNHFDAISPMVDSVERHLQTLSQLSGQRIDVHTNIQTLTAAGVAITTQCTDTADRVRVATAVTPGSAATRFALIEISANCGALTQHLEHLRLAVNPEELRESVSIRLRDTIRRLAELRDTEQKGKMAELLLELSSYAGQQQDATGRDVFAARRTELSIEEKIGEASALLREELTVLESTVDQFVDSVHANTLTAADNAIDIIERSQSAGLLAALALQLIAAAFVWQYVRRKVVTRFEQLILAMQRVASGDLAADKAKQETGQDELAQIAQAVEVFRTRSLDLRKRTDQLQTSEHALQEANYDLNQFVYHASHDLKAPMRAISALANILIEEGNTKDSPEYLEIIRTRAVRLSKLVDDILAYSRSGRLNDRIEPISISDTAIGARDLLGLPKSVSISFTGPDELNVQRIAFETVIRNLIDNAYKHHPNPNELHLSIASRSMVNGTEIKLTDNGAGIDDDKGEQVFEVFKTLRSRDEVEGSGMGLPIVRRIVETAGGTIRHLPTEHGACFLITWPLCQPSPPVDAQAGTA